MARPWCARCLRELREGKGDDDGTSTLSEGLCGGALVYTSARALPAIMHLQGREKVMMMMMLWELERSRSSAEFLCVYDLQISRNRFK